MCAHDSTQIGPSFLSLSLSLSFSPHRCVCGGGGRVTIIHANALTRRCYLIHVAGAVGCNTKAACRCDEGRIPVRQHPCKQVRCHVKHETWPRPTALRLVRQACDIYRVGLLTCVCHAFLFALRCATFVEYVRRAMHKLGVPATCITDAKIQEVHDRLLPELRSMRMLVALRRALGPCIEGKSGGRAFACAYCLCYACP